MGRPMIEVFDIAIIFFLILISLQDLKNKIIPNSLTLGIIFLGVLKIIFFHLSFEMSFIGFGVYPIIFLIIYGYGSDFFKKEIIGFGDIKLMSSLGFYLGYTGIYSIIIFYNIIFILSFGFVILDFILKKYKKNEEIAFAPFICIGFIIYKILVNI